MRCTVPIEFSTGPVKIWDWKKSRALKKKKHQNSTMSSFDDTTAAKYGCSVNKNGGIFEQGKAYNITKKLKSKTNIWWRNPLRMSAQIWQKLHEDARLVINSFKKWKRSCYVMVTSFTHETVEDDMRMWDQEQSLWAMSTPLSCYFRFSKHLLNNWILWNWHVHPTSSL